MQFNDQQKSLLIIATAMILMSVFYEIGFYLINGQTDFKITPFNVAGVLIAAFIGIIATRNK
ncbi:MAG: hypothetical protein WAX04_08640 [Oscillospiraceae bacterium]